MSDVWISSPEVDELAVTARRRRGQVRYDDDAGGFRFDDSVDHDVNPFASARHPSWNFSYLARDLWDPNYEMNEADLQTAEYFESTHPRYAALMRQAFSFLRTHGDRRYSDSTLMRVMRAAEDAERMARTSRQQDNMPVLVAVETPTSYDEETEVKTGGLIAAAITWRHNDGKTVLAVHRSHRRKKLGSFVAMAARDVTAGFHPLSFWVSAQNFVAQHFLLNLAFMPVAMNGRGAVRFAAHVEDED